MYIGNSIVYRNSHPMNTYTCSGQLQDLLSGFGGVWILLVMFLFTNYTLRCRLVPRLVWKFFKQAWEGYLRCWLKNSCLICRWSFRKKMLNSYHFSARQRGRVSNRKNTFMHAFFVFNQEQYVFRFTNIQNCTWGRNYKIRPQACFFDGGPLPPLST